MALGINRGNRKGLSLEQKDFLLKANSLAGTISEWTNEKAIFLRLPNLYRLSPAVILADILIESQWGTHPLSQPLFNKKYANNLSLLAADKVWEGKIQDYNGKSYRAYQDWAHFATDYSDILVFSERYKPILRTENQLQVLASGKEDPILFAAKASALIEFYELTKI